MKNLGCFHSYQPETPEFPGANYICNGDGVDWYTIAWDEERIAGNVYVGVDSSGYILSATDDGSKLFPVDMTVWEMSKSEVPSDLLVDWSEITLINGKFSIDFTTKAESRRQNLLSAAKDVMADWRTELQLEVITDEDKAKLIRWIAYTKKLKGLEFSLIKSEADYNSINWPPSPSF